MDQGSWKSLSSDRFSLASDLDAWSIQTKRISVSPHRLSNLPLLAELQYAIEVFLSAQALDSSFTAQQILDILVRGETCPPEDSYVCGGPCSGPWHYIVNTDPVFEYPLRPFTRADLEEVSRAIDEYVVRKDLNVFGFSLLKYRGSTVAVWDRSDVGWEFRRSTSQEVREQIDAAREMSSFMPNAGPALLVTCPCSLFASETSDLALPRSAPLLTGGESTPR